VGDTPDVEMAGAHAAAEKSPRASDSDISRAVNRAGERYSADMVDFLCGTKKGKGTVTPEITTTPL
jgi:hypothetical protein